MILIWSIEWMEGDRPGWEDLLVGNHYHRLFQETPTSMYTEDLVIDDGTQGEEVKHIREVVPDVRVSVLAGTLGIEAIGLCDAS